MGARCLTVEARSVNHRFLDVIVRLPREYGASEERLRALARQHLARGRCEVSLSVDGERAGGASRLRVDGDLAAQYHEALCGIALRLGAEVVADPRLYLTLPGVCELVPSTAGEDSDWEPLRRAATAAFAALDVARRTEGEGLAAGLCDRARHLGELQAAVAVRVPQAVRDQQRRLARRLQALLTGSLASGTADVGGGEADEGLGPEATARAAVELAALAERADVTEELVRIESHLGQWHAAFATGGLIGRRCDFLAQELGREWGTVAAKSVDAEVSALALEARVIVEQMREQVQNLE